MKKTLVILVLSFCIILTFSLCSRIWVYNSIDTEYLCVLEKDDKLYAKLQYSNVYSIDLENKSFSLADNSQNRFSWFEQNEPSAFEFSMFAGEYRYTVPEGYGGIIAHIEGCELDQEGSVVDACGYEKDGFLFGFVRVYKGTRGVHGNYSIEEIDHSLVFTYDAKTDEFNVEHRIDDVVIVSIYEDLIIYWKNKAYYCYTFENQEEIYLIDDKAYDSGFTQYSSTGVYFNSEICIIHMKHGTLSGDTDYIYVFAFSNGDFFELTKK